MYVADVIDRQNRQSLPAWGEWIEITYLLFSHDYAQVSPRMGRVD